MIPSNGPAEPVDGSRPLVAVITNGSIFSTMVLRRLIADVGDMCRLHVIVTDGLRRPSDNRYLTAAKLCGRWGFRYSAYKMLLQFLPPMLEQVSRPALTTARMCQELGVPWSRMRNLNGHAGLDCLRELRPAVLVSSSCPYRLGREVLDVPTIGAINAHSSLLPKYAGVSTYIHVLAEGEDATGITIHEMVEKFDAGRILCQESVVIEEGVSAAMLFTDLSILAGRMLAAAVRQVLVAGAIAGADQDSRVRSYRRDPTRDDIRALRLRGHRLLRTKEVQAVVSAAAGARPTFRVRRRERDRVLAQGENHAYGK